MDGASLAVARIAFGVIGALSMVRILANGWIDSLYAGPARHFTYSGFGWVRPPSTVGMVVLVCVVGAAAVAIAVGAAFRIAMGVFLVGFAWIELIDATTYLNHYWFLTLFGVLLLAAPATNELAVRASHQPIEIGWVWLLRAQIAVVYCFAGLAKLNADWLVHALPLRLWLPTRADTPIIGGWLAEPWSAYALSWAGALFDCSIVVLLSWRRTRLVAWLAALAFHIATWSLFSIGVFPWVMVAATTVFFAPGWPRRFLPTSLAITEAARVAAARRASRRFLVPAALVWMLAQVALPLRHLAIDGDHRWTGEGYRLSWNVLLTERGGDVMFRITDRVTGETWRDDASALYTPYQWKVMSTDADMIRQAAHALADEQRALGRDVDVRVDAFVSLNGRRATRLIDPDVVLSREPWRLGHQWWILPAPTTPAP